MTFCGCFAKKRTNKPIETNKPQPITPPVTPTPPSVPQSAPHSTHRRSSHNTPSHTEFFQPFHPNAAMHSTIHSIMIPGSAAHHHPLVHLSRTARLF